MYLIRFSHFWQCDEELFKCRPIVRSITPAMAHDIVPVGDDETSICARVGHVDPFHYSTIFTIHSWMSIRHVILSHDTPIRLFHHYFYLIDMIETCIQPTLGLFKELRISMNWLLTFHRHSPTVYPFGIQGEAFHTTQQTRVPGMVSLLIDINRLVLNSIFPFFKLK